MDSPSVALAQLGPPLDTRPLLVAVRRRLDELVTTIDDGDWHLPTACPGWSVADLVAHLIGDDLGRLSRTHDRFPGPGPAPGEDLPAFIDRLNHEWVVAFRRLSPAVLASLLGAGGTEVVDMWGDMALDDPATGVSWAGLADGPAWMDLARDTTEYWVHEQQLREAVGRPHHDLAEMATVLDVFARGLPHALRAVQAPPGARVVVSAEDAGATWVVERREDRWWIADGVAPGSPFAAVVATGDALWRRWTRHPLGPPDALTCRGDDTASGAVVDHLAVIRPADLAG